MASLAPNVVCAVWQAIKSLVSSCKANMVDMAGLGVGAVILQ